MLNESTFNDMYSYWSTLCSLLTKELSALNRSNAFLNEKVSGLETLLFSVIERTITKTEIERLVHQGITSITSILLGSANEKELSHSQTQTDTVVLEERKQQLKIKKIEEVLLSGELTTYGNVCSITELKDKRIASGGEDGNISISSYDVNNKKWKKDIYKDKAHNNWVHSLCALNGNKLLSGSCYSMKVWTVSIANITQTNEVRAHNDFICKIIPLSKERLASCSHDNTVKIWKDDNTYQCISTLKHSGKVSSILQLKGKDVLVSAEYKSSTGVSFWNTTNCNLLGSIKKYSVDRATHMIELPDGNIALSSHFAPYPIVIIDSALCQVKTEIKLEEYVTRCSSLCVLDQYSFVYVHESVFVQISVADHSVMFQSKGGKYRGYCGFIPVDGGKYFAVEYYDFISLIKPVVA